MTQTRANTLEGMRVGLFQCPQPRCDLLEAYTRLGTELGVARAPKEVKRALREAIRSLIPQECWSLVLSGRAGRKDQVISHQGSGQQVPSPRSLVLPFGGAEGRLGSLIITDPSPSLEGSRVLLRTLEGSLSLATLAMERLSLERKLTELAYHDALTGLGNRRAFDIALDREIERVRRNRTSFSLVLFDLDKFKQVNDRHGHKVGDEVLIRFGSILGQITRRVDTVVRLGGDEFAIIMPDSTEAEANYVVQRVYSVARQRPVVLDSPPGQLEISFSAGVRYSNNRDPEDIFNAADRDLYLNKAGELFTHDPDYLRVWREDC